MTLIEGDLLTRQLKKLQDASLEIKDDKEQCCEVAMDELNRKLVLSEDILAVNMRVDKNDDIDPHNFVRHSSSSGCIPRPVISSDKNTIFNKKELLERLGNKESRLATIIPMFVESVDQNLPALEEVINSDDFDSAVRYVHTLKGMTGTIGANRMFSVAVELEKYVKAADKINLKRTTDSFKKEYDLFKSKTDIYVNSRAK